MANTKSHSVSETGHAKNVGNFKTLFVRAIALPGYNPSSRTLNPANLNEQWSAAQAALSAVSVANAKYKLKVDERAVAFRPIARLVTSLGKALKATDGVTKETTATYLTLARKYRGSRVTAVKASEAAAGAGGDIAVTPEQISVAQLSFDNRVAHFSDIVALLSNIPGYAPNEPELTLAGIAATNSALINANDGVLNAITSLGTQRISRDEALYKPVTGLVDTAYKLKDYIGSKWNATSTGWKSVAKITFSRPLQ